MYNISEAHYIFIMANTKENPIDVAALDDLANVKSRQWIKYKCVSCGDNVVALLNKSRPLSGPANLRCMRCQTEQTNLAKHGVKRMIGTREFQEKAKKTKKAKYGDANYRNDAKREATMLERYGCKSASSNAEIQKKMSLSNRLAMQRRVSNGYVSPFNFKDVQEKVAATKLARYGTSTYNNPKKRAETLGVSCPGKIKEVAERISEHWSNGRSAYTYDGLSFDSSWELAFYIDCKAHGKNIIREPRKIEYETNDGKKHCYYPDFEVDGQLIEIKADNMISEDGIVLSHDMSRCEEKTEAMKRSNVRVLTFDDVKPSLDFVTSAYSSDKFLSIFKSNAEFPFPTYAKTVPDALLKQIHKSIWYASREGCLSPIEAWHDKALCQKMVANRMKYVGHCSPEDVVRAFSVTNKATRVSFFPSSLAYRLVIKYLQEFTEVFDPFSGFSGRMVGCAKAGKSYIGQDVNADHVRESNEVIDKLKLARCKVSQQDVITDSSKRFECLFTCPPYGSKEFWTKDRSEVCKSADEWISLCLEKYSCKRYLFVIDTTEKYKNCIVEQLNKKTMLGHSSEIVVLIEK